MNCKEFCKKYSGYFVRLMAGSREYEITPLSYLDGNPRFDIIVLKNQHGNCNYYFANVDQSTVRPNLEASIKDFCKIINTYRAKYDL